MHLFKKVFSFLCDVIFFSSADALQKNQELEFDRNKERFLFLKVMLTVFFFSSAREVM